MLVKSDKHSSPAPEEPATGDESFDVLVKMLSSGEDAERRNAARALADHPQAARMLAEQLGRERAISVRNVIVTSLIQTRSSEVVEALLPHLRSTDAGLRNEVIEALQEMPEEIAPYIDQLLEDPDSDVRIFAVNILGTLRHPRTPDWLIRVITEDPHVNVCATAIDCLAEVGDETAIGPLEAVERRFETVPFIRFAVSAALRRIRGD